MRKPGILFVLDKTQPTDYLVFALGNRQAIDARRYPLLDPHVQQLWQDLRTAVCPLLSAGDGDAAAAER